MPEFEFLAPCEWIFTEKVDGTNIRVMWDGERITFGGKTDAAEIPAKLVEHLQTTFTADALRVVFGETAVCLYGEGYGAGIQKGGGNYSPKQRFVLFDVLIDRWWIKREDIEGMAAALGIDVVPIIGHGTLYEMISMAEKGFLSTWGDFQAEGIVARPSVELLTRAGNRIITKIKYRDFHRA